jgi:hypothetical protein
MRARLDRPAVIRRACACRSERHGEAYLNLAYRWFCRLALEGKVADHATFLKNRHGRFRDSDASAIPSVVSLEIMRCQLPGTNGGSSDLAFRDLRMAPRNKWRNRRLALRRSNEPVAILGNESGKASAARRDRNLNRAHKIWL